MLSCYWITKLSLAITVLLAGVSVKRGPDGCGWRMRIADADGGWENADGKMRMKKKIKK